MATLLIQNLTNENVKDGIDIDLAGIEGNFTGDATATAADILDGLTAGINGAMVPGTMPDIILSEELSLLLIDDSINYGGPILTLVSDDALAYDGTYIYAAGKTTQKVYQYDRLTCLR